MAVHLVHLAGVMRASSNLLEIAVSVPLSLWRRVACEVFDLYFSFEIITFCDCSSPSLSHSRLSIPLACSLLFFLFSFFSLDIDDRSDLMGGVITTRAGIITDSHLISF